MCASTIIAAGPNTAVGPKKQCETKGFIILLLHSVTECITASEHTLKITEQQKTTTDLFKKCLGCQCSMT